MLRSSYRAPPASLMDGNHHRGSVTIQGKVYREPKTVNGNGNQDEEAANVGNPYQEAQVGCGNPYRDSAGMNGGSHQKSTTLNRNARSDHPAMMIENGPLKLEPHPETYQKEYLKDYPKIYSERYPEGYPKGYPASHVNTGDRSKREAVMYENILHREARGITRGSIDRGELGVIGGSSLSNHPVSMHGSPLQGPAGIDKNGFSERAMMYRNGHHIQAVNANVGGYSVRGEDKLATGSLAAGAAEVEEQYSSEYSRLISGARASPAAAVNGNVHPKQAVMINGYRKEGQQLVDQHYLRRCMEKG